jgi:hypothetical protein
MGKKRTRAKQVSKGVTHQNPNRMGRKIAKEIRRDWNGSGAQANAKVKAFMAGKNVMLTIPNPNTSETNKRFIRVNAKEVWRNT